MKEVSSCKGRVWTHIISLRREDAARLGFDSMSAWRNLLKAHRNDIAAAMKITPRDFRWCAAFHNEENHPHIHMMARSDNPTQGYLTKQGIRDIKSALENDIFMQEMLCLCEQKSVSRNELVREDPKAMPELVRQVNAGFCDHPEMEKLLGGLSEKLKTVQEKKQYGYLPKAVKKIVDQIINQMERLPVVTHCYEKPHIRALTTRYYQGFLDLHVIPKVGDIKLNKLTSLEIQNLYNDLRENCRTRKEQKGKQPGLSSSFVRGVHTMLHSSLEQAVNERLISSNPTDSRKIPKLEKLKMKILKPEQISAYLKAAEKRGASMAKNM